MSDKPKRECARAGCMAITDHDSGRCSKHRTEKRNNRLSNEDIERRKLYKSPAWRKIREIKLNNEPICESENCESPAVDVHHIKDVKDRPDLALSMSNLEALCKQCHGLK